MKDRLKKIRAALGMSQTDLAKAIGYERGHIGGLETGARNVTKRIRTALSEKLNVNPVWLETGEGEMFLPPTPAETMSGHQYLIRRILALPDDLKKEVVDFCEELLQNIHAVNSDSGDFPAPASLPLSDGASDDDHGDAPPTLPIDSTVRRVAGSEPKLR